MPEDRSFQDLVGRVRSGEQEAAAELVRRYESAIRRAVRIRLGDARLCRVLDSMDICQSVLASFFVRASLGQYELDSPEQLLGLLTQMARHKLADQVDRERAACRDNRRLAPGDLGERDLPGEAPTPSGQVAARELLREVQTRLTPEERHLAELRHEGYEWAEIAAQVGGTAEALRKRLSRAADRVARELGLDDLDHA